MVAEAELESTRVGLNQATIALDQATIALEESAGCADCFEAQCQELAAHVVALQSTRGYRMLAPLRRLSGRR